MKSIIPVYIISIAISLVFWEVSFSLIGASFIRALFVCLEILLILFGAVWLLNLLVVSKEMEIIKNFLSGISKDVRIQGILIGFFFVALIEGLAGFGTPAALAAPLLVSIGLSPVIAVSIALIGNAVTASFGAAGTPLIIGLGGLGFSVVELELIGRYVSLFHVIGAILVPSVIVYYVSMEFSRFEGKRYFKQALPFALYSSFVFILIYLLSAFYLGVEVPSILAGLFGLAVISISAKLGFLVPKDVLKARKSKVIKEIKGKTKVSRFLKSIGTYILIVLLLFISRFYGTIKDFLLEKEIYFPQIIGENISYSFKYIYTPSIYFFVGCLFAIFFYRISKSNILESFKDTGKKLGKPAVALLFTLAFVQLLIYSGDNEAGLESIPVLIAGFISSWLGNFFVLFSPLVGLFGSFISGSNTVSNLLFGALHEEVAKSLGISFILLLALQVVGGSIGNMVALHNVLAAEATVGLQGREGEIIRKTLWVSLLYAILVGIAGLVFVLLN